MIPEPEAKTRKSLSWATRLVILIVPIVLMLAFTVFGPRTRVITPPARVQPATVSLAQQLASIDAGHTVSADEVVVPRFRYLLRELSESFDIEYERVADVTVTARNQLRDKYGREVKLLFLMEQALDLSKSAGPNETYEGLMALMVVTLGN